MLSQTGLTEQQDLSNIQAQIAALQNGNPSAAITGATSILNTQQQAANLQSQLAQQLQVVTPGQSLYNPATSQFINSPTSTITPLSGGNSTNNSNGGIADTSSSNIWTLDGINTMFGTPASNQGSSTYGGAVNNSIVNSNNSTWGGATSY